MKIPDGHFRRILLYYIRKDKNAVQSRNSLLKRNETDPFLKRIITGDEKWVVYDNGVRKRSWNKRDEPAQTTSKADIHQKKVMLSVLLDFKGIVYFKVVLIHEN